MSQFQKIVDAYVELGATALTLLQSNGQTQVMDQRSYNQRKQQARKNMKEIVEFEKKLSKVRGGGAVSDVTNQFMRSGHTLVCLLLNNK